MRQEALLRHDFLLRSLDFICWAQMKSSERYAVSVFALEPGVHGLYASRRAPPEEPEYLNET